MFDAEPSVTCCASPDTNNLLEFDGDEPIVEHNIVHLVSGRKVGANHIREHVIGEGVALKSEQDEVVPPIVEGGQRIEDDRHKGTDVLNRRVLWVELGYGGCSKGGCDVIEVEQHGCRPRQPHIQGLQRQRILDQG